MLTPSPETICRSSTPARITIPVRVFWSHSQSRIPTTIATASMNRRASEYWIPPKPRLMNRSSVPGQEMLCAFPALKWASIWSARMIEIAIVISAWRRSWPWFQRRKACWIPRPTTATHAGGDHRGEHPLPERDLGADEPEAASVREVLLQLVGDEARRAGRSEPCAMFTTRIRPKISVKPLATTNRSPAKVSESRKVLKKSVGSLTAEPYVVFGAQNRIQTSTKIAAAAASPREP